VKGAIGCNDGQHLVNQCLLFSRSGVRRMDGGGKVTQGVQHALEADAP
jgi:hypothetical protein